MNYFAELGIEFKDVFGSTRIIGKNVNVFFGGHEPAHLQEVVEESMNRAFAFYKKSLTAARVDIPSIELAELSLRVVLHHLYVYDGWIKTYEKYKDLPFKVSQEDFGHTQSVEICTAFCKEKYKSSYIVYSAALAGKSLEEFRAWEKGRDAWYEAREGRS
jgi:hypothetical protein